VLDGPADLIILLLLQLKTTPMTWPSVDQEGGDRNPNQQNRLSGGRPSAEWREKFLLRAETDQEVESEDRRPHRLSLHRRPSRNR
jgi:hypothetical protein